MKKRVFLYLLSKGKTGNQTENNKTYTRKESVSPYGNGQFFMCRVHGSNDAAELLHEELQCAFVLLNIRSHQYRDLQNITKRLNCGEGRFYSKNV